MGRLTGKRAIITGAGSGIGRASAELFAAEGARVLAADRDGAAVAAVCAAIVKAGGDARDRHRRVRGGLGQGLGRESGGRLERT